MHLDLRTSGLERGPNEVASKRTIDKKTTSCSTVRLLIYNINATLRALDPRLRARRTSAAAQLRASGYQRFESIALRTAERGETSGADEPVQC